MKKFKYDPKQVIKNAISDEDEFCTGYQDPGGKGNGYITTIKLSTGLINLGPWNKIQSLKNNSDFIPFDNGCSGIVSYDKCECNDAYIGGINMLTASSFSGLRGVIWGYDIAKSSNLRDHLLYKQAWPDSNYITPIYSIEPLLDATERLYGHAEPSERRFNPIPGSMVVCANKSATNDPSSQVKEGWAFSFLALSILDDDDKNSGANLFIEDSSIIDINNPDGTKKTIIDVKRILENTLHKVTECVVNCGIDQKIKYKESFIGYKVIKFDEENVGCALACAPYVKLAKNAVPNLAHPENLTEMSLDEWEEAIGLAPLKNLKNSKIGVLGKGVLD